MRSLDRQDAAALFYHDHAMAIKASMPRPIFQGELEDGDCYGGQQYVPLLQNLGTVGFSVFLGDQMTAADFTALSGIAASTVAAG